MYQEALRPKPKSKFKYIVNEISASLLLCIYPTYHRVFDSKGLGRARKNAFYWITAILVLLTVPIWVPVIIFWDIIDHIPYTAKLTWTVFFHPSSLS